MFEESLLNNTPKFRSDGLVDQRQQLLPVIAQDVTNGDQPGARPVGPIKPFDRRDAVMVGGAVVIAVIWGTLTCLSEYYDNDEVAPAVLAAFGLWMVCMVAWDMSRQCCAKDVSQEVVTEEDPGGETVNVQDELLSKLPAVSRSTYPRQCNLKSVRKSPLVSSAPSLNAPRQNNEETDAHLASSAPAPSISSLTAMLYLTNDGPNERKKPCCDKFKDFLVYVLSPYFITMIVGVALELATDEDMRTPYGLLSLLFCSSGAFFGTIGLLNENLAAPSSMLDNLQEGIAIALLQIAGHGLSWLFVLGALVSGGVSGLLGGWFYERFMIPFFDAMNKKYKGKFCNPQLPVAIVTSFLRGVVMELFRSIVLKVATGAGRDDLVYFLAQTAVRMVIGGFATGTYAFVIPSLRYWEDKYKEKFPSMFAFYWPLWCLYLDMGVATNCVFQAGIPFLEKHALAGLENLFCDNYHIVMGCTSNGTNANVTTSQHMSDLWLTTDQLGGSFGMGSANAGWS